MYDRVQDKGDQTSKHRSTAVTCQAPWPRRPAAVLPSWRAIVWDWQIGQIKFRLGQCLFNDNKVTFMLAITYFSCNAINKALYIFISFIGQWERDRYKISLIYDLSDNVKDLSARWPKKGNSRIISLKYMYHTKEYSFTKTGVEQTIARTWVTTPCVKQNNELY